MISWWKLPSRSFACFNAWRLVSFRSVVQSDMPCLSKLGEFQSQRNVEQIQGQPGGRIPRKSCCLVGWKLLVMKSYQAARRINSLWHVQLQHIGLMWRIWKKFEPRKKLQKERTRTVCFPMYHALHLNKNAPRELHSKFPSDYLGPYSWTKIKIIIEFAILVTVSGCRICIKM